MCAVSLDEALHVVHTLCGEEAAVAVETKVWSPTCWSALVEIIKYNSPLHVGLPVLQYSVLGVPAARNCSSRQILRRLRQEGWEVKAQRGSHIQLVHPSRSGKVTVPHPRDSIPHKTLESIMRQAGLTLEGLLLD